MAHNRLVGLGMALAALGIAAQTATGPDLQAPPTPPPPAFEVKRLIPIDMPKYVSLRFGVDPATLSIAPDGIVRYVVVAISPTGSVTAMYEGIRCSAAEVKTFARYNTSAANWSAVADPQWQRLNDNLPSKHALALAQQGLCEGRSTAVRSVPDLIKALTPSQNRF
ncbi:MAG: CNP1-like family protein [Rhodoferax sp.]